MEKDDYIKHAGFALVAAALALTIGAAKASDKESWVWADRGDHRVAIVEPASDVVYRSTPHRAVYTHTATRSVIYSRPAHRKITAPRLALTRLAYKKPMLFPSPRKVYRYTGRYQYAPVSGRYVQNISYLEYR